MIKNKRTVTVIFFVGIFTLASCNDSSMNSINPSSVESSSPAIQPTTMNKAKSGSRDIDLNGMDKMNDINAALADRGLNVRLAYAETVTKANGAETASGQTIFANDRTKRLGAQWAPGDERRNADGNNLTYTIWDPYAPANFGTPEQFDSTPAIDASFVTWNNIKKKSKLDIVKRPNTFVNPSAIFGVDPFQADISEVGFLPGFYFELFVGPGSSSNVLGVTFAFVFIDDAGNPTDINNDGYEDLALKEVWYNDDFLWTDQGDTATGIDVETVALHENGHALGFGHFGKISITNSNDKLHISPRAVMNAIILGEQRDLLGTDKASYKNIYGNWPKN